MTLPVALQRRLAILSICVTDAMTGCGGGDAEAASTEKSAKTKSVANNSPEKKKATPADVLKTFLDAARNGDRDESRKMLTTLTIEQCAKHELEVNPPGTPTMSYAIGRVADAPQIEGGVFVESTWSEEFEDGTFEMEVLWAMRK